MFARVASIAAALAVLLALSACTPAPSPSPTPTTPFASEDEAFAAAEATYRAYVDALNQVDLSDPETFEAVYAWTTGDANASSRESFTQMHADGWTVSGATSFDQLKIVEIDSKSTDTAATVDLCLDVSAVSVTDSSGSSVVPDARPDRQALRITLVPHTTETGFAIETSEATESSQCG